MTDGNFFPTGKKAEKKALQVGKKNGIVIKYPMNL